MGGASNNGRVLLAIRGILLCSQIVYGGNVTVGNGKKPRQENRGISEPTIVLRAFGQRLQNLDGLLGIGACC